CDVAAERGGGQTGTDRADHDGEYQHCSATQSTREWARRTRVGERANPPELGHQSFLRADGRGAAARSRRVQRHPSPLTTGNLTPVKSDRNNLAGSSPSSFLACL